MLRATLRSLLARKLRLLLSAMAVVLGVAFVAGAFVLTDSLGRDLRRPLRDGEPERRRRRPRHRGRRRRAATGDGAAGAVPASRWRRSRAVDGVAEAQATSLGHAVASSARTASRWAATGRRTSASTGSTRPRLDQRGSSSGRPAAGRGELALDAAHADDGRLAGRRHRRRSSPDRPGSERHGRRHGPVRRTARPRSAATTVRRCSTTADRAAGAASAGRLHRHPVPAPDGVSQEELRDRVARRAAGRASRRSPATQLRRRDRPATSRRRSASSTRSCWSSPAVALFVGAFIIVNTFSILVAQRTRELALLRALGATRRQVDPVGAAARRWWSACVGSALGLGVGIGVALGLQALFGAFGADLGRGRRSSSRARSSSRSRSASWSPSSRRYLPARRAARIAPVAAMRDDVALPGRRCAAAPCGGRRRSAAGRRGGRCRSA